MHKPLVLITAFLVLTHSHYSFGASYKVRPGDNLTRISRRIGCTVGQVVTINSINNPHIIKIDQIIRYVDAEDIRLARLWLEVTLSDPALTKENQLAKKQALSDLENGKFGPWNILGIVQRVHSSVKQLVGHQLINLNLVMEGELFVLKNPPQVEIWHYSEIKKAVIYVSYFPGLTDLTDRQWPKRSDLRRILSSPYLEWYHGRGMVAISAVNTDTESCPQDAETVLLYLFKREGVPFPLGIEALQRLANLPVSPVFGQ